MSQHSNQSEANANLVAKQNTSIYLSIYLSFFSSSMHISTHDERPPMGSCCVENICRWLGIWETEIMPLRLGGKVKIFFLFALHCYLSSPNSSTFTFSQLVCPAHPQISLISLLFCCFVSEIQLLTELICHLDSVKPLIYSVFKSVSIFQTVWV